MKESEISVAVCYPGGRIDRLMKPLEATDMRVELEPKRPRDFDIIMLDNAAMKMPYVALKKKLHNTPVIYRIRGDMLRAYMEMNRFDFKYKFSKYVISHLDGAISIEKQLAKRFQAVTGVSPIGYATLVKEWENWPDTLHSSGYIKAITLTNCYYWGKIQPIIDYAPAVNDYLKDSGGYWNIWGRGRYKEYLKDHLEYYNNINFCGYTENPKEELSKSNLMLHLSNFDSLPNAILEGMASNLPVITNPYTVFERHIWPINIFCESNIEFGLQLASNPSWRSLEAKNGKDYIKKYHSKEYVGNQYVDFFKEVLE